MTKRTISALFTIMIVSVTSFAFGKDQSKQAEGKQPDREAVQTQEKLGARLPKEIVGKDGAGMALIPAGESEMGTNPAEIPELVQWAKKYLPRAQARWFEKEMPRHVVYLDAFYMDVYEVTNAQYTKFLNEYGKNTDVDGNELLHIDDATRRIEKVEDTYRPKSGYENHPVISVTWYGAAVYAQFYGKRLPTEAEWEKAARGGLVSKQYPWGDNITHDDANYWGTDGKDRWDYIAPVGSFPPNGYGIYDMAGNVWEWCADWYDDNYYSNSPRRNPTGPTGPGPGRWRVLRGGSCLNSPFTLRIANRHNRAPTRTPGSAGFRCVQDVAL